MSTNTAEIIGLPGLEAARKQLGWTRKTLSKRSGVEYQYLGRIERCECDCSMFNARTLAETLGVTLDIIAYPPGTQQALIV